MTRDKAIKQLQEMLSYPFVNCLLQEDEKALSMAIEALSADAVDVVRCRDCRHKVVTEDEEYNPEDIVCDYWMSDGLDGNDFCSYGEKVKP